MHYDWLNVLVHFSSVRHTLLCPLAADSVVVLFVVGEYV